MKGTSRGIMGARVHETPIAVVDIETTGLSPGRDRVIEVSVIRLEPGKRPLLALNTLVNPRRPVAATEIHGIRDKDVADAPTFRDMCGDFVRAISGSVVAAYNVYFDMGFLEYELSDAGLDTSPPHLCLMYLRPMLGLGPRCSLGDSCCAHNIPHAGTHTAYGDAAAGAQLMGLYLSIMRDRRINFFKDLASLRSYKFVNSFLREPLAAAAGAGLGRGAHLKPRAVGAPPGAFRPAGPPTARAAAPQEPLSAYWEALKAVLSDLNVTDEEIEHLAGKKRALRLSDDEVRAVHARVFSGVIAKFVDDRRMDPRECAVLQRVYRCLSQLGWAPGESAGDRG